MLTGVAVSGTYTCFNKNKQRDVIHLQELFKRFSFRVATFSSERYSIKGLHNEFQFSGEYVSMNTMCQRYMLQFEMRLATITLFRLSTLLEISHNGLVYSHEL